MQQNSPPPHSQSFGFLRSNAPWLGAGALLMFSSSYGQTFFISIFAGEIRAEYGLSDGQWGLIYTLGTTASALLMLWAGAMLLGVALFCRGRIPGCRQVKRRVQVRSSLLSRY